MYSNRPKLIFFSTYFSKLTNNWQRHSFHTLREFFRTICYFSRRWKIHSNILDESKKKKIGRKVARASKNSWKNSLRGWFKFGAHRICYFPTYLPDGSKCFWQKVCLLYNFTQNTSSFFSIYIFSRIARNYAASSK